jgi:hypothetical protein
MFWKKLESLIHPDEELNKEKLLREIELLKLDYKIRRRPFLQPTVLIATAGILGICAGYWLQSCNQEKQLEYEIIERSQDLRETQKIVKSLDYWIDAGYINKPKGYFRHLLYNRELDSIPNFNQVSVFNTAPNDLHTVLVSNNTTNPCKAGPANGCWTNIINAKAGDLISVQIYFHNCGDSVAKSVVIGMNPQITNLDTAHLFEGVIAEDHGIVREAAKVISTAPTKLVFIPGSVRLFPNQSTTGDRFNDEKYLFSQYGINIGDVNPGWDGQGVLVADFRVLAK